jgi:hypothetical protein
MPPRRLVALSALLTLSTAAVAACGGDDDPSSQGPDGPAATFTAGDAGCDVATDGFVYDPGAIEVRFSNELDTRVSIELLTADGDVAASADDVPAGDSVDQEVELNAGEHTVRCSDGTLTWTSTAEGETPSGVITGSPAYDVGQA